MMEHVLQFDWHAPVPETTFVEEADIENCTIEKILRNKFRDPLLSSESDDDESRSSIDWDEILEKKQNFKQKLFTPCLRPCPPYPKLSALSIQQHVLILRVLSAENPTVLEGLFLGRVTNKDTKAFETLKDIYLKEQQEYRTWAKGLWASDHCIRALRPKPTVESVYEAEFKVRAQRMRGLPKYYDVAAQIPLESRRSNCEAELKQELIAVNLTDMPLVQYPDTIEKQFTIVRPCTVPEPCQKHPYQIILPNEATVSILPIAEIHRELALYAQSHGTQYIASENALKCLVQQDRHWMIPLSVCETIDPDGNNVNTVVLDSEFSVHKESAPTRTLKAFRHLLEHALIPSSEREKVIQRKDSTETGTFVTEDEDIMTSDDEDKTLFIDTGEDGDVGLDLTEAGQSPTGRDPSTKTVDSKNTNKNVAAQATKRDSMGYFTRAVSRRMSEECQDIGLYSCTCKGTLYEKPPRRSFKKWQIRNKTTNENHDIIVHCAHKAKGRSGELLLNPIPEYQIDLGASEESADSIRSLALSLALRNNASVLKVRVDGPTGDVVTFAEISCDEFTKTHPDATRHVMNTVHSALSQLQGLLPGHYVLQHEPSHGANALLLSPRVQGKKLVLDFDSSQLGDADEAKVVKVPPTISTELLPYHKYRRTLPCAFTPFENQLTKEPKKPKPKKKPPPQAIKLQAEQPDTGDRRKWPRRNKSRRKNR